MIKIKIKIIDTIFVKKFSGKIQQHFQPIKEIKMNFFYLPAQKSKSFSFMNHVCLVFTSLVLKHLKDIKLLCNVHRTIATTKQLLHNRMFYKGGTLIRFVSIRLQKRPAMLPKIASVLLKSRVL